jgi:hypothetical protein
MTNLTPLDPQHLPLNLLHRHQRGTCKRNLPQPHLQNLPTQSPTKPSRPDVYKKKKSFFLQKPKVLLIGDSVAHTANFAHVEQETKTRIRSIKAYSSVKDTNARFPSKNITDVAPTAMLNTPEEDDFTHLVLGAPTVDISNLDTSKLTSNDDIDFFKQKTVMSCKNLFTVAKNTLKSHPKLEKVIILEHASRHDIAKVDPTKLKPKLALLANSTLAQLWHSSALKDKITIGKHNLDCSTDLIDERYKDDRSGRYDGVHLYGRQGRNVFTNSFCQILKSVIVASKSSSSPSFHSSCPQTQYQNTQRSKNNKKQSNKNQYNVTVSNQFELLGN